MPLRGGGSNGQIQDVLGCHGEAFMRFPKDLHRSPTNVHSVAIRRASRWHQSLLPASVNHGHDLPNRSVFGLFVWGDKLTRCSNLPRARGDIHEDVCCHTTGGVLPACSVLLQAFASGLHPRPRRLLRRTLLFASAPHVDETRRRKRTARARKRLRPKQVLDGGWWMAGCGWRAMGSSCYRYWLGG